MTAIQDIPLTTITGDSTTLAAYLGKVLLIVNVASKCGLTPQYEGLEALYEQYRDKGLEVLGFPANNFLGQEPGTDEEIAEFCRSMYSVAFPLFSKISVVGDDQHPLYRELTRTVTTSQGNPEAHRERLRVSVSPPPTSRKCCGTSRSSWSVATARSSVASPPTLRRRTPCWSARSKPRSAESRFAAQPAANRSRSMVMNSPRVRANTLP